MSGDDYKYQLSLKFGPGGIGMINIRADSDEELKAELNAALDTIGPSAVLVEAYNTEFQAIGAAINNFNAAGMTTTPVPAPAGELCKHGSMKYLTGTSSRGPWSGWFCPAPKDDPSQCKPKFDPK